MPRSSRSVPRTVLVAGLIVAGGACFDPISIDIDESECFWGCSSWQMDVPVIPFESKPTPVTGGLTFVSLTVGTDHVCGLTSGAGAYCWGVRDAGTPGYRAATSPEPIPGTAGLVRISAGRSFACGLARDGRALCWGQNLSGELGNGEIGVSFGEPTPVHGTLAFTAVSTTGTTTWESPHACGLATAGAAYCWGSNAWGQLGNGGTTFSATPIAVSGSHIFESISVGTQFTCGIVRGGAAYCWGQASDGQLGNDPRNAAGKCGSAGSGAVLPCGMTPVAVPGGHKFTSISAGGAHACGLDANGVAYCWGANLYGQLGTGTHFWSFAPARVSGALRFTAIAAGTTATCALAPNGDAHCWGSNSLGQLGDGTGIASSTPVKVVTDLPFAAIAVGNDEACALTPDGAAFCWGSNERGKLGKGS